MSSVSFAFTKPRSRSRTHATRRTCDKTNPPRMRLMKSTSEQNYTDDLRVKQLGKQTDTKLNCFNLAGAKQTQDLHSSIVLDFEEGTTDQRQMYRFCPGKGVFDGNVRVNKFAQRTDAKQITRNLLLVPKATVNTRPNLQIVADDVKCTHGCTVSDSGRGGVVLHPAEG